MKKFINKIFNTLLNLYYSSNVIPNGYINKNFKLTIVLIFSIVLFIFTRFWFNNIINYTEYTLMNECLFSYLAILLLISILFLFVSFYLFYLQFNLILKLNYLTQVLYKTFVIRLLPNNEIIRFYLVKNIFLSFLSIFVLFKFYELCSNNEFTLLMYLSSLTFTFVTALTISYIIKDNITSFDSSQKPAYSNIQLFVIFFVTVYNSYLFICFLSDLNSSKFQNINQILTPLYMFDPSLDNNITPDAQFNNRDDEIFPSFLKSEDLIDNVDFKNIMDSNLKEESLEIKDGISLKNSDDSSDQSLYSSKSDFVQEVIEMCNKIDADNKLINLFANTSSSSHINYDKSLNQHRTMNISPLSKTWSECLLDLLNNYKNKISVIKTKLLQSYMDPDTKIDSNLFGKVSLRFGFRNIEGKELSIKNLINVVQLNHELAFASRGKYNSLFYLELNHKNLEELILAFKYYNATSFSATTLVPQALEHMTIQHRDVERFLLYPGNIEEYNKFSNILEYLLQENSNFSKRENSLNDIAKTTLTKISVKTPVNFSFKIWVSNQWVNHYVHDLNHFDLKILYDLGEVRKLSVIFDTHGNNHFWPMSLQEFRNLPNNSILNWIKVRNNDEYEETIFKHLKINVGNIQLFLDRINPNFYGHEICFYLDIRDYIKYIQEDLPEVWNNIKNEINDPYYKWDNIFYNSIKHYINNNSEEVSNDKFLLRRFSPKIFRTNKKISFNTTEEKLTFYHQMYRNSVERHIG